MHISAICVLQFFGRTSDTPITGFWSAISSFNLFLTMNRDSIKIHATLCTVHYLHHCTGMIYGLNRFRSFLFSFLHFPSSLQRSHVALEMDIVVCLLKGVLRFGVSAYSCFMFANVSSVALVFLFLQALCTGFVI